jgi:hypothetical protein
MASPWQKLELVSVFYMIILNQLLALLIHDLPQVGGFLHQYNRPPQYNWNIVETVRIRNKNNLVSPNLKWRVHDSSRWVARICACNKGLHLSDTIQYFCSSMNKFYWLLIIHSKIFHKYILDSSNWISISIPMHVHPIISNITQKKSSYIQ